MAVNDNFANRTFLSGLAANGQGSNIGATVEAGEPVQDGIINSVWWSWTAPNDGTFTLDTKNSSFDTFLSVFTGSAVNSLSLIGSNDDVNLAAGDLSSFLSLNVKAGTIYQIAVDGYQSYTGNIQLNIVPLVINGTPNSDSFRTTAYPETINGLADNDYLYGDAGNDILNGNDGNDLLLGETGNDILNGNDGNDALLGGTGNDTLTGGTGSDQFAFDRSSLPVAGVDTITDFGLYSDTVLLGKTVFSSLETSGGNPTMGGNVLQAGDFSTINEAAISEVAIAGTSLNEIVYNTVTGNLFYNPNNNVADFGTGGGLFATIVNSPDSLSNGNFRVIFGS
jgi:Ca2+-binding RTX toxin-like protein